MLAPRAPMGLWRFGPIGAVDWSGGGVETIAGAFNAGFFKLVEVEQKV